MSELAQNRSRVPLFGSRSVPSILFSAKREGGPQLVHRRSRCVNRRPLVTAEIIWRRFHVSDRILEIVNGSRNSRMLLGFRPHVLRMGVCSPRRGEQQTDGKRDGVLPHDFLKIFSMIVSMILLRGRLQNMDFSSFFSHIFPLPILVPLRNVS
jgi:hypothetical protein